LLKIKKTFGKLKKNVKKRKKRDQNKNNAEKRFLHLWFKGSFTAHELN